MAYETTLSPPKEKTLTPPGWSGGSGFILTPKPPEEPKEPEKKEESGISKALKIAGDFALDIAALAIGSRIGGPIGSAIGVYLKNAATVGLALEKAYKTVKTAERIGRIVGETGALTGLYVAKGQKTEEAIKGAALAQAFGLTIPWGIRAGISFAKRLIPEGARKSVAEAIKGTVHKWLFDSQIPKKFHDIVLPDAVRLLGNKEHIHRLATAEFNEMVKSGDYEKLGQLVSPYLRNPKFYESAGVQHIPDPNTMEVIASELTKVPKNKQSALPYVLIELGQFVRHAYKDQGLENFAKKYPVLFKDHEFYRWSTQDYFSLIAKEISPERTQRVRALVTEEIPEAVGRVSDKTHELISAIRYGSIDEHPGALKEIRGLLGDAVKLIHQARKQGLIAKESRHQVSEIVRQFKKIDTYLAKIAPSSLREFTKIKSTLGEVVSRLNSASSKMLSVAESVPSIKESGIYDDLKLLHDHLIDIRGYLGKLNGIDELITSRRIADVLETTKSINEKLTKIEGLAKQNLMPLSISMNEIEKSIVAIQKLHIYKTGLNKEYENAIKVLERALGKVDKLMGHILPKDMKAIYEFAHKIYYSRIGLPRKVIATAPEAGEKTLEYQMENVVGDFRLDLAEILDHLKRRKYPTLFAKYYNEIARGIHPMFDSRHDLGSAIAATYVLPQSLKQYHNWLSTLTDNLLLDRPITGYHPMETKLISGVVRQQDKIPFEFSPLYRPITVGGDKFFVLNDVARWLDRMLYPVLSGRSNIFQSGKGLWGGLSTMNTLAKRIAVMFGIIHMKALSTAAYGIGETKSLAKAWKAFFANDTWFHENVVPLQEEVLKAINEYGIKTKFLLPSFDNPAEMLQRLRLGKVLQPVIDIIDKSGVVKVPAELDKRLWDRLFYTLKASSAHKVIQDFKDGKITKEMAEKFLDSVTASFGGNYEWLYMKPEAREFIRFLLFAPDWYLSMMRHLTKSVAGDPYFADFFRRIFVLHYVLANEVSWQLNRKTTYEQFLESGNWQDLFEVPFYTIDKKTGQWKRGSLSFLGFEIEGLHLLGALFAFDGFHELMTTNKTVKQVANDVAAKWVSYILSAKRSSILRMINDILEASDKKSLSLILQSLPMPILGSAIHSLLDRHVVFTQTGARAPAELILPLYQAGIKYHATTLLSDAMKKDLLKLADEKEAKRIMMKYATEISQIADKLRRVPTKYKLQSDNPKTLFENALRVAVSYHINSRWSDDIEKAIKEGRDLRPIYDEIISSFNGTVISYYPKFRELIENQILRIARVAERRERYEKVEQE